MNLTKLLRGSRNAKGDPVAAPSQMSDGVFTETAARSSTTRPRWFPIGVSVVTVAVIAVAASALYRSDWLTDPAGSPPGHLAAQLGRPHQAHVTSLCRVAERVDRLVVQRHDAFPQNHVRFTFPAHVVVASPEAVRASARALCALKPFPSGPIACPADWGIAYHLTFEDGSDVYRVIASPTGCPSAAGDIGKDRWAPPHLWHALGTSMGLRRPDQQSFAGKAFHRARRLH